MQKISIDVRILIISLVCLFIFSGQVGAACRNPNLVIGGDPAIVQAAASGFVEITWFGHSFFQVTSSAGTRIITDPFSEYMGYPVPEVWPHVITVSKDTSNHGSVDIANGDPLILWGQDSWGLKWNEINTFFRDVLIYNVPIHMRSNWYDFMRGSAFVFEMDGMCICHTGDIGEPFNEDQLDLIGHIDILFVPIGGRRTVGPEGAKKLVEQLKPKIAIPMHYWNYTSLLESFIDGPYPARFLEINKFSVSKDTLPPVTEIFIPKVIWHGRDDE